MFFALQNLMKSTVFKVEKPWEWGKPVEYEKFASKEIYSQWCKNPTTDHMFFSGFEGLDPAQRVSAREKGAEAFINMPYKMHGIVWDYDGAFNGQPDIDKMLKKPPVEYMPAYIASTFSGHCRMIWNFESPITLIRDERFLHDFVALLAKKLKAGRWFAGFDEKALNQVSQYFEAGRGWMPVVPEYYIPTSLLNLWSYEAAKNLRFADWDEQSVSLEAVKIAVDKRWPGAYTGPFMEGVRCRRFWDPDADNETAVIIHKDGVQCFTKDRPFISWREMFGTEWIDSNEAAKLEQFAKNVVYEIATTNFWIQYENEWTTLRKQEFSQYLRCNNFDGLKKKNETASAVDRLENHIRLKHSVAAACPFTFEPQGVIRTTNGKYLNTSTVRVLNPAPEDSCVDMMGIWDIDGPRYFPFIHEVLATFFDKDPNGVDQMLYFMCWLKHFYENALILRPQPGQCLFCVGKEGKGKTLLVTGILAKIMGGAADGADWLINGVTWTDFLVNSGLIYLDDSQLVGEPRKHAHYCAVLKKLVANQDFTYNGKYKANGQTRWNGRFIGLCNEDHMSRTILPSLESSNKTKVMLFLANPKQFKYPRREDITEAIAHDAPYLCRHLLKLKTPDEFINTVDTRFFLHAYQHPLLYQQSLQSGQSHQVREVIQLWLQQYNQLYPGKAVWKGTASALYQELAGIPGLVPLLPKNGMQGILIGLASLSSRGFPIKQLPTADDGMDYWTISTKLAGKFDKRLRDIIMAKEEVEMAEKQAPCMAAKISVGLEEGIKNETDAVQQTNT